MSGERVLVIDNSADDVRFLIEQVLNPHECIVYRAKDGEEGLRKALSSKLDVIITELWLPRRSGLEIMEELNRRGMEVPVIVTTAHVSDEAVIRALRLGAVDFLVKPFDAQDMWQAIQRATARRQRPEERGLLIRGIEEVNRQLERKVKELSILYGIGKAVTSLLDLEKLLNRIVEAAVYLTNAEEGFLLLVDEETNELYMRAAQGLGEKYAQGFRVRVEDSLSGQVVKTGQPVMIGGARDQERFKVKTGYLVKSLLHVPLKVRERVIGVLSVDNKVSLRAFTDHDLYLLSALADYAAIAIENARLYQKTEEEARKLAQLLEERGVEEAPPREEVEQLARELQLQRQQLAVGLNQIERLAMDLEAQAAAAEELVERLRSQQAQLEGLAQQIPLPEVSPEPGVAPARPGLDWHTLFNALEEGILVSDAAGRVQLVNEAAARLLRVKAQDLMNCPLTEACPDPRWARHVQAMQEAMQKGGKPPSPNEATVWMDSRMIAVRLSPLTGPDGQWEGIMAILRDVTWEREAQRAWERLGISISEELRTPLTTITTYTDLLLAEAVGILGTIQRKFLQRVRESTDRMVAMLNDLVEVWPTEVIQPEPGVTSVEMGPIIAEAIDLARQRWADKGLRWETDLAPQLPAVLADPDGLLQIMTHLLDNAARITPSGGTVYVRAEARAGERVNGRLPDHLVVSVRDGGPGIAPQDQGKVFNRYYRLEHPEIPGLGDSGLGMVAVKMLVEDYGGRVWVESEPGQGSTFTFVLPVTVRPLEGGK